MEQLSFLVIAIVALMVLYTVAGLRIVGEHEQGVVMRFGRFVSVVGPGLQLIVPFVDQLRKVDLRTLAVTEKIEAGTDMGRVQIWGESWPAKSADGTSIAPGTPIKLEALDGRYVVVKELQSTYGWQ